MEHPVDPLLFDDARFVPNYLTRIANGLVWAQSRLCLEALGLGLNEARALTTIGSQPSCTAGELAESLDMNRAIVSLSLRRLIQLDLVSETRGARRRVYTITPEGAALRRQVVELALRRETRLMRGFTSDEQIILLGYLARLADNLPHAQALTMLNAEHD